MRGYQLWRREEVTAVGCQLHATVSFRHATNTVLSSAFICTAVWRLVKGLYLLLYQRHQREELNCLGQSTIAQYVKQDRLGPTLNFTLPCLSWNCLLPLLNQCGGPRGMDHDTTFLQFESAYFESFWFSWIGVRTGICLGKLWVIPMMLAWGSALRRRPCVWKPPSTGWCFTSESSVEDVKKITAKMQSRAEQCPTITRRVPHFT